MQSVTELPRLKIQLQKPDWDTRVGWIGSVAAQNFRGSTIRPTFVSSRTIFNVCGTRMKLPYRRMDNNDGL
jgi:hypothetical protein